MSPAWIGFDRILGGALKMLTGAGAIVGLASIWGLDLGNLGASLGKPILCFADAGGAPEFVEEDAGFVVPYLDVGAMADRLATLFEDDDLRMRLGNTAANKVRERHDVAVGAPKILRVIERFLN